MEDNIWPVGATTKTEVEDNLEETMAREAEVHFKEEILIHHSKMVRIANMVRETRMATAVIEEAQDEVSNKDREDALRTEDKVKDLIGLSQETTEVIGTKEIAQEAKREAEQGARLQRGLLTEKVLLSFL